MSPSAAKRALPAQPSLEYLRKLAKERLRDLRLTHPAAKLAQAQLDVAREHGFTSWRALHAHVTAARNVNIPHVFRDAAKAIVRDDLPGLRAQLAAYPPVVHVTGPHPQWGGRPQLLHVAIETGRREAFDLLLDAGADPSGQNDHYDGWSPLMLAVHWQRDAMRDELLRRSAAVGLIEARMLGDDARVARLLADDTGSLQRPMPNDATPLHFARTRRAAEMLLAAGVDATAKDKYGHTALQRAIKQGDVGREVAALLTERGGTLSPVDLARSGDLKALQNQVTSATDLSPLLFAGVEAGHAKVVRWLIKRGVDVNQPNANGATPLHAAAWEGRLPIVKLLVEAGVDAHARDGEHEGTPADWSRHNLQTHGRKACLKTAEFLEAWMASHRPSKRTIAAPKATKAWKPLMDACYAGDAAKVAQLLDAGADPNVLSPTNHRHRPLHRAIERRKTAPRDERHVAVVRRLLEAGADPSLRGTHGRHTALQLAAIDSSMFVPLLRDRFKPLDFWHACVMLDDRRVAALLKQDATLASRRDENEWLPLHYAAASALFEERPVAQRRIVEMLLDAGADVNATFDYSSRWPIPVLFYACGYHNNPALTELLLRRGAVPYDNESVYHASDEGHAECLAVIERLADPIKLAEECTKCLRTQLHWGHTRGMAWLLAHGADPHAKDDATGLSAIDVAVKRRAGAKVLAVLQGRRA